MTERRPPAPLRRPLILGFAALAVLVLGFGAWSMLMTIAGAVVLSGQIEVASRQQVVQHPDGGVVERIHVTEGGMVEAGALLITLDGTFLRSELAITENQFFEMLARRGRLEAERDNATEIHFPDELTARAASDPAVQSLVDGQIRLSEARAATLRQRAEQLRERQAQIASQIQGIDAQIIALNEQITLNAEELRDQQSLLDKGLTQVGRVLALRRNAAALGGQLGALQAQRAESEGRITEIEIEILNLGSIRQEEAVTELRDLGYREIELAEQRRALAERIARLEIRAPVAGIVHGLQVTTPRSVLRSADPVANLIPQDQPLVITAHVRTNDISNVYPGQPASLRFPAFNSRTTPELAGVVALVSADAFQDNQTGQSYYRIRVELAEGEAARLNGEVLLPGMPVEIMLMTQPHTPMDYLLKPFTDYFSTALRET